MMDNYKNKKFSDYRKPVVAKPIIIEDIELADDDSTGKSGVAFNHEMLSDFIGECEPDSYSLADINEELKACGIKPITLDQIKIIGIEWE